MKVHVCRWARSAVVFGCLVFAATGCRTSKGVPSEAHVVTRRAAEKHFVPSARVPQVESAPAPVLRITFGLPAALTGLERERALGEALRVMRLRCSSLGMDATLNVANGEIVLDVADLPEGEFRGQLETLTRPGRLEVRRVNDELDPLSGYSDTVDLPPGISVQLEKVAVRPDQYAGRRFAQMQPNPEEPPQQALKRVRKWLASVHVPPNHEMGVGRMRIGSRLPLVAKGYRSFVLSRQVELTNDALVSAEARSSDLGWLVAITMTSDGGKAFEKLTATTVKRRLALVVDQLVLTAPVVATPIQGGRFHISMGGGPPEEQRQDAEELALGGGAQPRQKARNSGTACFRHRTRDQHSYPIRGR